MDRSTPAQEEEEDRLRLALIIVYRRQAERGPLDFRAARASALALVRSGAPLELPPYPGPEQTGRRSDVPSSPCDCCGRPCWGLVCRGCFIVRVDVQRLRAATAARSLTLAAMSRAAGLAHTQLSTTLSRGRCTPRTLELLAAALGVSAAWLRDEE